MPSLSILKHLWIRGSGSAAVDQNPTTSPGAGPSLAKEWRGLSEHLTRDPQLRLRTAMTKVTNDLPGAFGMTNSVT